MNLTDRDELLLRLVHRFKFCLGRHIRVLAGFSGQRATDRRLRALVDAGYLGRKKYLYGVPYLYTLTHKGRILLGVNKREDKIRLERVTHDIYVLDVVIYFVEKYNILINDIESEKELHIKDGFGGRKHQPDFAFASQERTYAIEIELNANKINERLEKNIRDNYMNYDKQIWITNNNKTFAIIKGFTSEYSNIEIIKLEEVLSHVRERYS